MRNNKLMFYGSSYDRGLEHLLKMWPKIIKEVPDAKLHVCYGWDLFSKFYADNPERMAWKDSMDKLMTQKGITHLGRISHGALRDLIERAGIFAYPTHFGETSCITAMKCQAWGAIPVVINYAGIRETVKFGVKVEGDIYDQETKDDYVKQLVALLKDDKRQEKIRKEMIPWALENFTWESVAKQWTEEFKKPPSLEKQLETLLDHNQALKAYELSKGTEFEKKIYPLVEHVFDPEVYKKYYNNELLEIPVSDEIAYDCTKLAPRFEWLVKEITNKMPKEVLDIGCADGYLCLTLASKGVKCKGINLYKPSIEVAEKRAEKKHLPASFAWMDFHKENGQYEVVVMFEVLEHLPEPQKAIEKAYSLLKEGGSLYLSTPRTDHKGVEEHIKNKYANPDRIKPWDDPRPSGHLRLWTEEEFRELLKDYNVKQFIVNQDREMLVEIKKGEKCFKK